jgi:hypothetical protein
MVLEDSSLESVFGYFWNDWGTADILVSFEKEPEVCQDGSI